MKFIFKIIRRIIMSFCLLYTFNLITSKIGFYLPINIFTLTIVTIIDFPGILLLIILRNIF
jgi:pro-sigmaK processing inhibitor BofA